MRGPALLQGTKNAGVDLMKPLFLRNLGLEVSFWHISVCKRPGQKRFQMPYTTDSDPSTIRLRFLVTASELCGAMAAAKLPCKIHCLSCGI